MALYTGRYGNVLRMLHWEVLRTSHFSVLRTSVEDVPRTLVWDLLWPYIEDHMGKSIGRYLETSSGHNFAEWETSF